MMSDHEKAIELFKQRGGQQIFRHDPIWPLGLERFSKPPQMFFFEGDVGVFSQHPCIAIVGSRQANAHGLSQAQKAAALFVQEACVVVSGGALGIDCAAHTGAIQAKGNTLAVLPNPLSMRGTLLPGRLLALKGPYFHALSFYDPSVPVGKTLFVARNQYIAALSDAVIVMQGLSKSGALYTAQAAKRLKIPLFAVPGDLGDPLYEAPNSLLAEGSARAFVSVEQVLACISGRKESKKKTVQKKQIDFLQETIFQPAAFCHPVLDFLRVHGMCATFDDIAHHLSCSSSELQLSLLELELEGHLKKEGPFVICLG